MMLTQLLQGDSMGFLPRSIAQPYLDSQKLYELRFSHEFPVTRAYVLYLTKNRDTAHVKLSLELLGLY
ncbi:hypothetical protein D3C85_1605970 [compost metagenome]